MGELLEPFAELHQGGRLARDLGGDFRPWKIDGNAVPADRTALLGALPDHLEGSVPLGVYPIAERAEHLGKPMVHWGAVDWDVGDEESLIHAINTTMVLAELDITAWIELSRSKGCHLWLYSTHWIPAATMRTALLAACQLVDAPVTEVYPKQPTTGGGWGNGLRLPYPGSRPMGRQCVIDDRMGEYPLDEWVRTAYAERAEPDQIYFLAERYVQPQSERPASAPLEARRSHHEGELKGLANHIWKNGPRIGPKGGYDRSSMLHTFACELFRQGYMSSSVEILVAHLDRRWGQKYVGRKDGAQRIKELVSRAQVIHNQPSFKWEGESEPTI